jgi:proline dehydrogenase
MKVRLPFALARRFVAAETLEGAIPVVQGLHRKGLHVSMDLLGEYIRDRTLAEKARSLYMDLIDTVADTFREAGQDTNISIKLSMLGQKIDEDFCLDNLRALLTRAKARNVFVRLDMEGSDTTASTLNLFEAVYPDYPDHVGVVLQAYLKRTAQDVARMCELGARVRLCKGAYKEPADLAWQDMDTIRQQFVALMQQLLLQGRYPGIATHDDRLIAATKQFVAAQNLSTDRFEFQMLYGIRPSTQVQLVREGYHLRVYVPYGRMWFPYFSRRLRERKENVWFVVSNLLRR